VGGPARASAASPHRLVDLDLNRTRTQRHRGRMALQIAGLRLGLSRAADPRADDEWQRG
jgi:hypothetical protein